MEKMEAAGGLQIPFDGAFFGVLSWLSNDASFPTGLHIKQQDSAVIDRPGSRELWSS